MSSVTEKSQEFNKAVVRNTVGTASKVMGVVWDGARKAFVIARDSGATAVGQARSATQRTIDEASEGVRDVADRARSASSQTAERASAGAGEVAGQARAQGKRGMDRLDEVVERTADRAIDAVESAPSSGTPYEQWTKSQLYERAQELDIQGRSAMSKRELIAALRSA